MRDYWRMERRVYIYHKLLLLLFLTYNLFLFMLTRAMHYAFIADYDLSLSPVLLPLTVTFIVKTVKLVVGTRIQSNPSNRPSSFFLVSLNSSCHHGD